MELPVNPSQLIDLLRAWFFAKDRSVVLAKNTFVEGANIATPGTPVINRGRLYWKDKCWYQLDEDGVEASLCNGVWGDFSPTLYQAGNVAATLGLARMVAIGKTIIVTVRFNVTGAGNDGEAIEVRNLPEHNFIDGYHSGIAVFVDTGTATYLASVTPTSSTVARFRRDGSTSVVGVDPSFALANGDFVMFSHYFEGA